MSWGSGADQVGLLPAATERVARGPQAVAVAPSGVAMILDSENGRVLTLDSAGSVAVLIEGLAVDAEDIAVGPDGAVAVYSGLRSQVWIFDADGAPAGTIDVDRSIRDITGLTLGASRQVTARTAHQERFALGSPAAPTDLPTTLRGKREGAAARADQLGLSVLAGAGVGRLIVVSTGDGELARSRELASFALPGALDAAMIIGAVGDLVCMRSEKVDQAGEALAVTRRAVCLNAKTGVVSLDVDLDAPGTYLPRQELALGGDSPRLVSISASTTGLTVAFCEVSK